MPLTVGSLFAGIGGFDLGFERAGFEIKWQVEIDPFCRAVLAKHSIAARFEDVRDVHGPIAHARGDRDRFRGDTVLCGRCLEPVDVICGGFPCQPHSVAGRRGGAADDRDLWPQFIRIIRDVRPRWVVAENVPGLLSNDAGRFFGGVLRDLAESGFDAEWDCLPASAFGAPHQRDRVWLIAYPNGQQFWLQPIARRQRENSPESEHDAAAGTLADAASERTPAAQQPGQRRRAVVGGEAVANADGSRSQGRQRAVLSERAGERITRARGASVGDPDDQRELQPQRRIFNERGRLSDAGGWLTEPDVGRVAYGVPARVDRLRGLGNAIVPQIAQWIAERIKAAEGVT